ncbi:ABC transporter ATP-binding protein [Paenibacillus macerans]|uniref:ABC transporter family protein n=1 Tax=Paenibacillus macerans TaxID=44252 RepID=A0A090ZBJ9_PAEMA|nr:ABC transporter ATP-binding protein [Paenibacillus macerans]KFN07803.1 ABC transporter family protein [Paenibacillus macerans]MCY7561610.1 ABC transporter ATP-binding protein [Paenibacillus macerans]MEC0153356.1 ABC transporter ATP-binding protein [Paenibacillus macerans]SUD25914.1 ABC transporter [Paenibacillus macerans]GBK65187.1 sugar ABC transporter ATP-binding protein [Paenibacillus macerans]
MSGDVVIEVKNVKKSFKIFADKSQTLKGLLSNIKRAKFERREVIKGISFQVKKGEVIGIIGKNGCGKSTTLKMLSKLLKPSEGEITIKGRVSSLIELGAGFHPDMTGRENIYVNASIFGYTKKEIDAKMDEIIKFSELEDFIDSPVRTYSSGMYMRLAFSVAISVDPEVLLVDEILGVGDAAFQTKCFNRIKAMKDSGMTIVIVSHSTGQVEKLCNRAIWIDNGIIKEDGPPRVVCSHYLEAMEELRIRRAEMEYQRLISSSVDVEHAKKANRNLTCRDITPQYDPDSRRSGDGDVEISHVVVVDDKGNAKQVFDKGEPFTINMAYRSINSGTPISVTVGLVRDDGVPVYEVSTESDSKKKFQALKEGHIQFRFLNNNLLNGKYFLNVYIYGNNGEEHDIIRSIIAITIKGEEMNESGVVSMRHVWDVDGIIIEK